MKSIFLLILFGISLQSRAQEHNGIIYRQLIEKFLGDNYLVFKEIQGRPVNGWLPEISTDSNETRILQIGRADITYKKLRKKEFIRSVSVNLVIQENGLRSEVLSYADTLKAGMLRKSSKTALNPFGEKILLFYPNG